MEPYALPTSPHLEVMTFTGNTVTAGGAWQTWTKPVGKSFVSILAIGGGGGGGAGAIGANSTAAGGGGGGGGAMTIVEMPLALLPNRLYISVSNAKTGAGVASYVSTQPNTTANHVLVLAQGGGAGGSASGATAGTAGSAGSIATAVTMPLGWAFSKRVIIGHAGTAGGVAVNAANLTVPATGVRVTGGTGGGGLPAAAVAGTNGGSFNAVTAPSIYPLQAGGQGSAIDTNEPASGQSGFRIDAGVGGYAFYGGTGGASTHGTATGTGLVQAEGGNGGVGSGGGGSGGALTGSAPTTLSYGGSGLVVITCY